MVETLAEPKIDSGSPAHGNDVIEWMIARKPSMVGSDAHLDGPDVMVHGEVTMKNGIFNLETMDFRLFKTRKSISFCLCLHHSG